MPQAITPMKARLGDPTPSVDWQFEVKWDGYRAIAFCDEEFRLQGRRLNRIDAEFPELAALGEDPRAAGLVLDGELVVFDQRSRPDFQLMQTRQETGALAEFLIFDLLWDRGRDLRSRTYLERREILEGKNLEGSQWSVPERMPGELREVLDATSQLGLEGVVAKDPAGPYVEDRRSEFWLKVKHSRRQEFVVGGWLPGKGHRSATIGSILVGYRDRHWPALRYAGRVGTGFDDRLLKDLRERLTSAATDEPPFLHDDLGEIPRNAIWSSPELVVEVRFSQWTRDGHLRAPVFLGFRPDKPPADVVREPA